MLNDLPMLKKVMIIATHHAITYSLSQIHHIAKTTINSPTLLLQGWKVACLEAKVPHCKIPWDVKTRWNSMSDMGAMAITYQEAISRFTANLENDLQEYKLSPDEWILLQRLVGVLKVRLRCL